jgi:hypothetical protein
MVTVMQAASNGAAVGGVTTYYMGQYSGTSAVSSIKITNPYTSYTSGTLYVYTSA